MEIKLSHLNRSYQGFKAVDDISLTLPSRGVFGIIGKSGAGKSSLMRLMSLLETPDSGEVYYDSRRVDNLSREELLKQRRRIGMIFQTFNLFSSRNCARNIAYPMEISGYPKQEIDNRVEELLALVGLEGRGGAPVSTLSGGQMQRVAIARALTCKPDILFCDEATSALDPQTTTSILELIKQIQKQMDLSVVMITHQMEVVRDACSSVAVLDKGKVVESGTVRKLFSSPSHPVTRDFLSRLGSEDRGGKVYQWSKKRGTYTLRFPGDVSDQPVISRLSRHYNVDFNLRAGGVQIVNGEEIGTMVVDISHVEEDKIGFIVSELRSEGVIVEEAEV